MLSPEEIKAAVLKECMGLCLDEDSHIGYDWGSLTMRKYKKGKVVYHFDLICGLSIGISSDLSTENGVWPLAYRLLNLQAKEIELNLGLMTISRDNEKMLRESYEKALEGRDARIAEIEERAQGLVAFTEAMQTEFKDGKYGYMAKQALNQWKGGGNG